MVPFNQHQDVIYHVYYAKMIQYEAYDCLDIIKLVKLFIIIYLLQAYNGNWFAGDRQIENTDGRHSGSS